MFYYHTNKLDFIIWSFILSIILVCEQEYQKSNDPISLKLGAMIGPCHRKNWLSFSGDPVTDVDSVSHFWFCRCRIADLLAFLSHRHGHCPICTKLDEMNPHFGSDLADIRFWINPQIRIQISLTSTWPHLRCDVGLEEGEYRENCLCLAVLCTIVMVDKDTSSSYRSVNCIGLWCLSGG